MSRISIVGAGRVGTTLAAALVGAGHTLVAVVSRRLSSAEQAVSLAGAGQASTELKTAMQADLLLLTVPDDQLGSLAGSLTAYDCPAVCHTSGAASSEVLAPLPRRASAHPLQTFAEPQAALENLPGTYWALEGEPTLLPQLELLVRDLQGHPLQIRTEQKVLYHAGAVMACNYLTAVQSIAVRMLSQAGIDPAQGLAALLPLVQGTLNNLSRVGLPEALTGPVSRGDVETIGRHLDQLPDEFDAIYRLLGKEAIALAGAQGKLSQEALEQLRELLE